MALDTTLRLRQRLFTLARKDRYINGFTGVARLMISLLIFAGVFFLVDWLLMLSSIPRVLLLASGVAAIAWIAKKYLYDPLRIPMDEDSIALRLERRFPDLKDRLISVIQLTRPGGSRNGSFSDALIRRLEKDTAQVTSQMDFSAIIDWPFIRRVTLAAAAMVVIAVMSAAQFPGHAAAFLSRVFLGDSRYPTETRAEIHENVKSRVVRGDDWSLRLEVNGKIPDEVVLYTKAEREDATWEEISVKPELGRTFAVTLPKVQDSFLYRVHANDFWTDMRSVEVLIPVAIRDEPTISVVPPSYTSFPPVRDASLAGIEILQGSQVEVRVPTTKKVVSGQLIPTEGEPVAMKPIQEDETGPGALARFMVRKPTSFTVRLKDVDGLNNEEPYTVYRLRVRPDRTPKVVILKPKKTCTVVPYGNWMIHYTLSDDIGVKKAWIAWRVGEDAGGEEAASDPTKAGRREVQMAVGPGKTTFEFVPLRVSPGDTVYAWVEAADALSLQEGGHPTRLGRSQEIEFRVITQQAKEEEMEKRLLQIEEQIVRLHDDQKDVNSRTEQIKKGLNREEGSGDE